MRSSNPINAKMQNEQWVDHRRDRMWGLSPDYRCISGSAERIFFGSQLGRGEFFSGWGQWKLRIGGRLGSDAILG